MDRILVVEDAKDISDSLCGYLRNKGYEVLHAKTLNEARLLLSDDLSLILLDYNLPDGNGLDFCKEIKNMQSTPIIFLTVNSEENSIIACLDSGADDYITKPFKLEILSSRINAILRRVSKDINTFTCNGISLDVNNYTASLDGNYVELTAQEYKLLYLLMSNKNRIMTRDILLDIIWDSKGYIVNDNTLTVTMKRLRTKLNNPPFIKTIRGVGYRLEDINEQK